MSRNITLRSSNPVTALKEAIAARLAAQPVVADPGSPGQFIPALREALSVTVPTWSEAGMPFANVWATPGDIIDGVQELAVEVVLHCDAVLDTQAEADALNLAYTVHDMLRRDLHNGTLGDFCLGATSAVDWKRFFETEGENAGLPFAFIATVRLTAQQLT